jgi:ribosomal protein L11 methyltransferase
VIRLALRVRSAEAEIVLAELIELAPTGVEEVDLGAGVTEFAIYGAPGELPALPDLRAVAGGALVDVHTSELPDDWSERWRAFHHPVLIEPSAPRAGSPLDDAHRPGACGRTSLYVRPPWAPPAPLGGAPG